MTQLIMDAAAFVLIVTFYALMVIGVGVFWWGIFRVVGNLVNSRNWDA